MDCILCRKEIVLGEDHVKMVPTPGPFQYSRAEKAAHTQCLRDFREKMEVPYVAPYEDLLSLGPGDENVYARVEKAGFGER